MSAKKKTKARKDPASGDIGGDVIRVTNVGSGAAVAAGRGAVAGVSLLPDQDVFALWRTNLAARIDAHPHLSLSVRSISRQENRNWVSLGDAQKPGSHF